MKKEIQTEIEIKASAEKVWEILTDFKSFPSWNPFVVRVQGEPKMDEPLKLDVQLPKSKMLKLKADILKIEPNKELRWAGGTPLNSFRGEHYYIIESLNKNKVRFVHGEHFSGFLVRLVWLLHGIAIEKGYELMNNALKKRAEETK